MDLPNLKTSFVVYFYFYRNLDKVVNNAHDYFEQYTVVVVVTGIIMVILEELTMSFYFESDKFLAAILWIQYSITLIPLAIDAICLLISGIMLIKKWTKMTSIGQKRFNEEVEWFWSLLFLIAIFFISWLASYVYISLNVIPSLTLTVLFTLIGHFDAIILFALSILRKEVINLLLNKYRDHHWTIPAI